jgi:hypothetical protein
MPVQFNTDRTSALPKKLFKSIFSSSGSRQFCSYRNRSNHISSLLQKWGFGDDMWFERFRYEQNCRLPEDEKILLKSFFGSAEVRSVLNCTGIGVMDPTKLEVYTEELSTKATTMNFFNKFEENGAISHNGHIRGRMEEMHEDISINSLIRETIFLEESELYDAFSEKDRKELLFRIFQHLNIGGASNQYEDHVEEYFKATKVIYKDLLSARKNDSGDTEVISKVFSILSLGSGGSLYSKHHISNFTYIIVDPMSRSVILWRFRHRPIW